MSISFVTVGEVHPVVHCGRLSRFIENLGNSGISGSERPRNGGVSLILEEEETRSSREHNPMCARVRGRNWCYGDFLNSRLVAPRCVRPSLLRPSWHLYTNVTISRSRASSITSLSKKYISSRTLISIETVYWFEYNYDVVTLHFTISILRLISKSL